MYKCENFKLVSSNYDKHALVCTIQEEGTEEKQRILYLPNRLAKDLVDRDVKEFNKLFNCLIYFGKGPHVKDGHVFRFFLNEKIAKSFLDLFKVNKRLDSSEAQQDFEVFSGTQDLNF